MQTFRYAKPKIAIHWLATALIVFLLVTGTPCARKRYGARVAISLKYEKSRVNERSTPDKFTKKEFSVAGLDTYSFENGQALHMNLGAVRVKAQGERDTVGTWGIGLEFPLLEKLQLTAEAYGEEHSGPDKAIGLRYEIADGLKLYGSVGCGNERSFGNLGVAWEF